MSDNLVDAEGRKIVTKKKDVDSEKLADMMVKAYALLVQKKEHEKMERLLNMTKNQYIENCNMEKYYAKFGSDAFAMKKE